MPACFWQASPTTCHASMLLAGISYHLSCQHAFGWHLKKLINPLPKQQGNTTITTTKQYYTYIMTNKRNGTLYTGVTSNLTQRTWQHKSGQAKGFTSKYNLHQLVYYEIHTDILAAIQREKRIQSWKRNWKIRLIEKSNPNWEDLYFSII